MKAGPKFQMQMLIQNGIFAVLLVAAACLIVWVTKDIRTQWDLTATQRNTLAEPTRNVLTRMQGPIVITAYATPRDATQGNLRQQISDFLEPYKLAKRDITLQFIDPNSQPNETKAANIRINGELVVQYGKRSEHLTGLSEQAMANLLQRLLRGKEQVVMYVTGHGEPALDGRANFDLGDFGQQLTNKGFRISALNLAVAQEVPDNASVLVLATARTKAQPGEVTKIKAYLERGGNLLWLIEPAPLLGMEPLAEYLGLTLTPGSVIDPLASKLGAQPTNALGTSYGAHPITENFALNTIYPTVRRIETKPENADWHTTQLVQVAQTGWLETDDISKAVRFDKDHDVPGPITIAVAMDRTVKDKSQRVVVVGGSGFLTNAAIGLLGNLDLGVNALNWLAQDENLITIQPRTGSDSQLKMNQTTVNMVGLIFLFMLPAAFLFTGGMIWWRRRRG